MNYTFFLSCKCEYTHVVHQYQGETLIQCPSCLTVNSKKTKKRINVVCKACDHHEAFEPNQSFYNEEEKKVGEKNCKNCSLKGKVGFDESQNDLFYIDYEEYCDEPCNTCNKNRWEQLKYEGTMASKEEPYRCPSCFNLLEKEMSSFWDEEN